MKFLDSILSSKDYNTFLKLASGLSQDEFKFLFFFSELHRDLSSDEKAALLKNEFPDLFDKLTTIFKEV